MTFTEQFHAILALPIGAGVLAAALCFFPALIALVTNVIEQKRERRRDMRDLAARFSGARDE